MKRNEIIAVVWFPVGFKTNPNLPEAKSSAEVKKVEATTLTNEAITRIKTRRAKMMKSFFEALPIVDLMISPTDFPPFLTEAKSEPKSCNPPKKIPPTTHQRKNGTHQSRAAWIGPLIEQDPDIEEK